MTEGVPERVRDAFAAHEAFEAGDREDKGKGDEFVVTTAGFDARVTPVTAEGASGDAAPAYRVVVRVPTLSGAVSGSVADVVEEGWFDTLRLRLEDAAMAVPESAEVAGPETDLDGETVVVRATVRENSASRAPRSTKALVDYVEGTYAEGIVPGYDYRPPVSDLLASARHDDSEADPGGPMPM